MRVIDRVVLAVMTLDIIPAEGPAQLPTYYTGDVQTLKAFVTECRRLKEGSGEP